MIAIGGGLRLRLRMPMPSEREKASPGHQQSKGKHQRGVDGYDIQADDSRGA
jgi:hypothetical protein